MTVQNDGDAKEMELRYAKGDVHIFQLSWRHAVVARISRVCDMTGRVYCSNVCTIRSWRNNAGLEGVARNSPWDPNVTLEIAENEPAAPGVVNSYQSIFTILCKDQEGWKRRLAGLAS